jgi:hypothetical protein
MQLAANSKKSRRNWLTITGYLLALMAGLIIVAIFPWSSIGLLQRQANTGGKSR